ncbi:FAD-dependent oxidoreductase [Acinetobacter sp. ULE_I057]|jgi:2-polyprenyl-6-methoxyphenol hydroxylase-like FAD-dependent oxidoreductase|uniref:FAD-dependent oxidoreductase n=1 Tax=Acinetobacter sp. ULE_I057 TaxID=3373070 RepID=UPI003AF82E58
MNQTKIPKFAIVGAGTAGLAAAILLAQQNIQVTIFEKVSELKPVGAGLLLQPSGLAVFEHLDVLDDAVKLGAMVTGLEGQLANGFKLVDSHYAQADPDFYGLGIHRASLCHVLAKKCHEYPDLITWQMNADIQKLEESIYEIRVLGTVNAESFDEVFDSVIIANGARSQLRPNAWVKVDQAYPWGAKWTIVPECLQLNTQILHQFYDRSKIMMGILPTGAIPSQSDQRLSSIFWSLPTDQLGNFLPHQHARLEWLKEVSKRWKPAAEWLEQVIVNPEQKQQWFSAHYRDVVLSKFGERRIGIIGDAAHAMSPQLGQGANMALLDAWALGQAVHVARNNETIDYSKLWQNYHQHRKSSSAFYQFLSRLLTPLYQSDLWWAGGLRDLSFSWMYRIPYFRKEMAITVSGLKSGIFSQMKYEDIARSSLVRGK